jgi:ankyrin repeat protein
LVNTKHILDTFLFLLQACQYLLNAAYSGDLNTVKRWVHCTDDSCITDDGNTPLHLAADRGHLEVCRLLLDWGAKLDTMCGMKDTALHHAARFGHLPVVKLLVERGANVRLKNSYGQTASERARAFRHTDVADWLN